MTDPEQVSQPRPRITKSWYADSSPQPTYVQARPRHMGQLNQTYYAPTTTSNASSGYRNALEEAKHESMLSYDMEYA